MVDFFEKITESIDKGIKTVTSKSKEILEITKLKGEIRDVESSIHKKFQSLGKKVFEMINRDSLNENDIREDCKEIASLFKRITELENLIKQVEIEALKTRYGMEVILCPNCKAHNKYDAKFCMNCGSPIIKEKIDSKNCPSCGAPIKEGAKFCMRCGGKIN